MDTYHISRDKSLTNRGMNPHGDMFTLFTLKLVSILLFERYLSLNADFYSESNFVLIKKTTLTSFARDEMILKNLMLSTLFLAQNAA